MIPAMGRVASDAGRKALAVLVLLLAAYVVFKVVVGVVTAVAWVLVAILALLAVAWAVRVLL
jgi:hypothetical protein